MSTKGQFDQPRIYLFEVRGQLDASWSDWFDGFSVMPKPGNLTALVGPVEDQSALYGLIARLGHLGLLLLSVQCLSDGVEEYGHEID